MQGRGEGYFSSRRPPTLLGKAGRRSREADKFEAVSDGGMPADRQTRKKRHDETRRLDDEARARRVAELNEGLDKLNGRDPDEPDVVVEKSNVIIV